MVENKTHFSKETSNVDLNSPSTAIIISIKMVPDSKLKVFYLSLPQELRVRESQTFCLIEVCHPTQKYNI